MSGADEATWDRLLEHGQFLRALARALVSDEARAADVEQSTWLAAALHPPQDQARVRGWLRRVATNVARQFERGERRRLRRESLSASSERLAPAAVAAEELEAQRLVLETVRTLDEKYRTVVVLRFYDDLGPSAISERLGLPVATVRTQLQRALAILREQLDARFEGRRERWQQALAPLAGELVKHGGAPAIVAIAVVALGLVAGGAWSVRHFGSRRSPPPQVATAPAIVGSPTPAPVAPPPGQAVAHREATAVRNTFDGRVVDSIGRALDGVEVDLFEDFRRRPPGSASKQSVRSDARGGFRLVDVPYGPSDLIASRPGFVRSRALVERGRTLTGLRTRTHILYGTTIVLEDARTVRGVVVDPDGRPVATAAVIEFDPFRSAEGIPAEATVDGQGRFELSGVPLEKVELVVVAPRFGLTQVELPAGAGELTIRMAPVPACALDLTVVDSKGSPLSDGEIEIQYKAPAAQIPFLVPKVQLPASFALRPLTRDGHVVFSDMPPGECEVRATVRAPVDSIPTATVALDCAESKTMTLRANAELTSATIRGVVRAPDGSPIAGATVVAPWSKPRPAMGRTDAQGRFEINGSWSAGEKIPLLLDDAEWTLNDPRDGRGVVTARAADGQEFTAQRTASIRGRALTSDRSPAAGIELALHAVGEQRNDPLALAITGPNGDFEFASLPPRTGSVEIGVDRGMSYVAVSERCELQAGSVRDDVQIVVPAIGSIRGRVVDSKGRPRPGLRLRLDGTPLFWDKSGTNRDGEFLLADLGDGVHTVEPEAPSAGAPDNPLRRTVTIAGGRPVEGIDFTLDEGPAATGPIRGRIVLPDRPAKAGTLFLVDATDDAGHGGGETTGQTFRLDGREPGRYRLVAMTAEDAAATDEAPVIARMSKPVEATTGGPEVILELPPLDSPPSVVARFSSADARLAETTVTWDLSTDLSEEEVGMVVGGSVRLGNGELRICGAAPGTYRMSFGVGLKPFFSRVITIPATGAVDLGVIPVPKSQLHGIVTDRLGTPIANALVVVDSNLDWRMLADRAAKPDAGTKRVKTNDKGEFTIAAEGDGVCIWKNGFSPRPYDPGEDPLPDRDVFVLLQAGDLRLTHFPSEMRTSPTTNWVATVVWSDAESELHGYRPARSIGFSPGSDATELFRLPVGHHVLHLWKKGLVTRSDDDPPPPEPRASYAWPIEVRAGEVTTIDVGERW